MSHVVSGSKYNAALQRISELEAENASQREALDIVSMSHSQCRADDLKLSDENKALRQKVEKYQRNCDHSYHTDNTGASCVYCEKPLAAREVSKDAKD